MSQPSYACCACNAVPHTADWGANGLICYGACNAIALYDPYYHKIGRVEATLHKHTGRVNVARWLRRSDHRVPETELLSASTDGTAIVWTAVGKTYVPVCLEDGNPLTIADGLYLGDANSCELLLCVGSTEGTLDLWHRDERRSVKKVHRLTFGRSIPTAARLAFLPRSDVPLVAIALDDCSIRLYCRDASTEGGFDFVPVQTLHNHEDWITCMDFTRDSMGDCHLATGSQDTSVRLWRIYADEESRDAKALVDESQRRIKRFSLEDARYAVTLESILSAHEHWVYGVHWRPGVCAEDGPPALLSCAMDKSMIIWEADEKAGGIWRETIRVGEVGGNSLGFYGCKYAPDGLGIMAHGYHGSFHLWRYDEKERGWLTRTGPTGHFSGVVDLCWDPKGRFLTSASLDQTTRVHAPWPIESGEVWHEIGRPQVHGYDLSCLASLGSYTFASGAEEKVVRIFTAPRTFRKYLSTIASTDDDEQRESITTEEASVPALGLTNKAVFDESSAENDERIRDLDYSRPPNEEELIRHTLWPELQKLYGHGYEIFSMASRSDGRRLATACKSATAEHSAIIIWCTSTWSQIQKLSSHRLTVTQVAFSPDNAYLVAVSRDRRFTLHRCNERDDYELVATSSTKNNPLHSRIIWCCAWSHDSKYFATGSRDGKIGVWRTDPEAVENGRFAASLDIKDSSVTALAFAPRAYSHDSYVLAVGYDSGCVDVRKIAFAEDTAEWRIFARYDSSRAHHSTVRRLAFRPIRNSAADETEIEQVASCGLDHAVKIHDLRIDELEAL